MISAPEKTIVALRIGRLGDFLVALPAFAQLRDRFPGHRLILVTAISADRTSVQRAKKYATSARPAWYDWVCPRWFDEVVHVEDLRSRTEWQSVRRHLRRHRVRRAFILPFDGERRRSLWKKWFWLKSLVGVHVPVTWSQRKQSSDAEGWHRLSRQTRAPLMAACDGLVPAERMVVDPTRWRLAIDASAREWAAQAMSGIARPRVAVFASATFEHKRWPAERFGLVLAALQASHRVSIVVVGAAHDRGVSALVAGGLDGSELDLTGMTTLPQLAAVLAACDLFVGNDGGPAHLAAAVGTPVVTLMSGVHAANVWDPAGGFGYAVRAGALACAPCGSEFACPLGHSRCMHDISVEQVIAACRQALQNKVPVAVAAFPPAAS